MKIEITKPQLQAIIDMKDDIHSMIGCGDADKHWMKYIKLVNQMLKNNKIKEK